MYTIEAKVCRHLTIYPNPVIIVSIILGICVHVRICAQR